MPGALPSAPLDEVTPQGILGALILPTVLDLHQILLMWHLGLTYCVYPLDPLGMEAPPLQDVGGVTQGAWVGILGEISPPQVPHGKWLCCHTNFCANLWHSKIS